MTLKQVGVAGLLQDISDNFADIAPIGTVNGLGNLRVARFEFDMATVGNRSIGAHGTGVTLPIHAIVIASA